MKIKLITLIIVQTFFLSALSAQITQVDADGIVSKRLSRETQPYTVYAKEDVQEKMLITTSAKGKQLELDYACWVYYIQYADGGQGRYLIVKESTGNLLELDAESGAEPENLAEWKVVAIESFAEYTLTGTSCQWENLDYDDKLIVVDSKEELENYISCKEGNYPEFDFSKHTLLLASGQTGDGIVKFSERILQLPENEYRLEIDILLNDAYNSPPWVSALIVNKLNKESNVELTVTKKGGGTLQGTKWKLVGLIDVETGSLKEFAPKYNNNCYWFTFENDSLARGRSTGNRIGLMLRPSCFITLETLAGEGTDDGFVFTDAFPLIYSFELGNNYLKLYGKNRHPRLYPDYFYLKFKKIGG